MTPDAVTLAATELPVLARLAFGMSRAGWLLDEPTPHVWRELAARVYRLRVKLPAVDGPPGALLDFARELESVLNERAAMEADPPSPATAFRKARLEMDSLMIARLDPLIDAMAEPER